MQCINVGNKNGEKHLYARYILKTYGNIFVPHIIILYVSPTLIRSALQKTHSLPVFVMISEQCFLTGTLTVFLLWVWIKSNVSINCNGAIRCNGSGSTLDGH